MSGHPVSDIQTRAEGKQLYVQYNTITNIVKYLWYTVQVLWCKL